MRPWYLFPGLREERPAIYATLFYISKAQMLQMKKIGEFSLVSRKFMGIAVAGKEGDIFNHETHQNYLNLGDAKT